MRKNISLFLLLQLFVASNIHAQPAGGPPKEAISICSNSNNGDTCSFNAPHGQVNGNCRQMGGSRLVCVPVEKSSQSQERQPSRSGFSRVKISGKDRGGKAVTSLVPDTNQGSCFDEKSLISCPKEGQEFFGQDANYFGATPNYRDNLDGTISDLVTGLTWQKAHNSKRLGYYEAKNFCESLSLGKRQNWRLPTIKELFSIADFRGAQGKNYFLDSAYFDFSEPDQSVLEGDRFASTHSVQMMGQTWSSTIYSGAHFGRAGTEAAFFFNFLDGHIKQAPTKGKMSLFYRCVQGDVWGENKFVDNQDKTVTDRSTNLQWQKIDDGKTRDWKDALAYCQNLELAGKNDWRLPSVKELQTIVNYQNHDPALDLKYLKLTDKKAWFWSSTTHGDNISMASYVCFGPCTSKDGLDTHGAGAQRSDPKTGSATNFGSLGGQEDEVRIKNYVRCVR